MSLSPLPFDPEIQALLEEIVADPDSTLLRVPQTRLSRWIGKREPPLSAGESLLTRAERHLVQEYRESVALMLYRACQRRILGQPSWKRMIHRSVLLDGDICIQDERTWRVEVSRELETMNRVPGVDAGFQLLERCVPENRHDHPSASELAAASLRLVPRDETRIWLALALHEDEHDQSAFRALDSVLGHQPSRLNRALALENRGFVCMEQGNLGVALQWYRAAALGTDESAVPALAWLNISFQLADEGAVLEAASSAGELVCPDHASVLEHEEMWLGRRRSGEFEPTAGCVELARRLEDRLPPVGGRIARVLL